MIAVMFLSDDPWTVETGRCSTQHSQDIDRAIQTMSFLCENTSLLDAVVAQLTSTVFIDPTSESLADGVARSEGSVDTPVFTSNIAGESTAELRCRVAALQLQLDDVTAIVRRNERNVKDLLSSFHFWSLLLLDELRGYRTFVSERMGTQLGPSTSSSTSGAPAGDASSIERAATPSTGPVPTGTPAQTISEQLLADMTVMAGSPSSFFRQAGAPGIASLVPSARGGSSGASSTDVGNAATRAISGLSQDNRAEGMPKANTRPKRIFRDGKWIVL